MQRIYEKVRGYIIGNDKYKEAKYDDYKNYVNRLSDEYKGEEEFGK